MSETPRSYSELLAALADNTVGAITPEDIRDMLASLYPARAQLDLVTPAATTFAGSGVYGKVAGTTTISAALGAVDCDMPSDMVIRVTRTGSYVAIVRATLEVLPAANNKRYTFAFAKNGTAIASSALPYFYGNLSGNAAGVYLAALVPVTLNDQVSLVVKNDTDTTAITASVVSFSLITMMG